VKIRIAVSIDLGIDPFYLLFGFAITAISYIAYDPPDPPLIITLIGLVVSFLVKWKFPGMIDFIEKSTIILVFAGFMNGCRHGSTA